VSAGGSDPKNPLEEALLAAATGGAEDRFYQELLRSDLYAAVDIEGEVTRIAGNQATLAPDARVKLLPLDLDGERAYAAFTSPLRLEQAIGGGVPYAGVPARALLRDTPRGSRLILNPGVWYGKELLPSEIERLAAGVVPGAAGLEPRAMSAGTSVMLGLPADPPTRLIEALREHFGGSDRVAAARLGQAYDPEADAAPHPVVGVEPVRGVSLEDALAGVDDVVRRSYEGFVDFVPTEDHEIGEWLRDNTTPFFERERPA
jgi:hypothetical protein